MPLSKFTLNMNYFYRQKRVKFLAFSDTHIMWNLYDEIIAKAKEERVSFAICAGDFSSQGRLALDALALLAKICCPVFLIPGES